MDRRGGVVFCLVASMLSLGCERALVTSTEAQLLPGGGMLPTLTSMRKKSTSQKRAASKRVAAVTDATTGGADPFRSPEECLTLLRQGQRANRSPGTARIGAWNVRWFPDGIAGNTTQASLATDVEWMACTLAWMNVDAVALAEIKSKSRSMSALELLVARLDALTNGKHVVRIDDCPDENAQHVAWLLNEHRVSAADWQMHSPINPNGEACRGQLRPGFGVKLRFAGGLDLHAISVHLKSGVLPRDLELRRTSFDGLERVMDSVTSRAGDADVVVAGDFNTMGCRTCETLTRGTAESSWLDNRLRAYRPEARRVPSDLGCSHYYQRQPSLLDHFLVTRTMREAPLANVASVYGHCRELGCEAYSGSEPPAAQRLSDHCPIVLSLQDQDLD